MPRGDDGGFEQRTLDSIIDTLENVKYNPDFGEDSREYASFELDGVRYHILSNKKINGTEYDILIADDVALYRLESNAWSRDFGYLTAIECKNLSSNIPRHVAMDIFARNYTDGINRSIIVKGSNDNGFSWKKTYEVSGTECYDIFEFPDNFWGYFIERKNNTRTTIAKNQELFNTKFKERLRRRTDQGNFYQSNNNSIHQKIILRILEREFSNAFPTTGRINDLILEEDVGFSIPGAVNLKPYTLLINYTSNQLSLPEVRQLLGNCLLTGSKGLFYYDETQRVSSEARRFIDLNHDIIGAKPINLLYEPNTLEVTLTNI